MLCSAFFLRAQPTTPISVSVTARVMMQYNHCGGDEIDLNSPEYAAKPASGKLLYIKKGKVNSAKAKVIATVRVNDSGYFFLNLPPGDYLVVDESKKDLSYFNWIKKTYKTASKEFAGVDLKCLSKWFSTPHYSFNITEGNNPVHTFSFSNACPWDIPCVEYRGSYPP